MVKIEKVKGMRDYETPDMILRKNVFATVEKIFEKRGFVPLDTPALEKWKSCLERRRAAARSLSRHSIFLTRERGESPEIRSYSASDPLYIRKD